MVENFKHDEIQPSSLEKEGAQLSDLLREEFLGDRKTTANSGDQSIRFKAEAAFDKYGRGDSTRDFVQATLDTASKRSNIAVGANGRWSLDS